MLLSTYIEDLQQAEETFAENWGLRTDGLDALQESRLRCSALWEDNDINFPALLVAAPCLTAFARWIKQQKPHDADAFFIGVMREGRFLAALMERLFSLKTKELWLNRGLAMRAAFGAGDDEALINWLSRTRMTDLSLGEAFDGLEIAPPPHTNLSQQITAANVDETVESWRESGLLEEMRKPARALMQRVLMHWQSLTSGQNTPVVLMDFACAGNIQRSLRTIFLSLGDSDPLIGANFLTTKGASWALGLGSDIRGFLAHAGSPSWIANTYARTPELIEIFTASTLGPLTGFDETGLPLHTNSILNKKQQQWLEVMQPRLLDACALYHKELDEETLSPDLVRLIWGRLLLAPLIEEVFPLRNWPLDLGLNGKAARTLAPPLSGVAEDWSKAQTAWPAGSRLIPSQSVS